MSLAETAREAPTVDCNDVGVDDEDQKVSECNPRLFSLVVGGKLVGLERVVVIPALLFLISSLDQQGPKPVDKEEHFGLYNQTVQTLVPDLDFDPG